MDAFVKANIELEYLNPRTGSPAPGTKKFKDAALTHQAGRGRLLVEFKDDAYEIPLKLQCFIIYDKFMHEGKLGISCHTRELRCTLKISAAKPVELRLFAACVRAGKRLDPAERNRRSVMLDHWHPLTVLLAISLLQLQLRCQSRRPHKSQLLIRLSVARARALPHRPLRAKQRQ